MRFRFLPREEKFFELFVKLSEKLKVTTGLMQELFSDLTKTKELCAKIKTVEKEADEITRQVIRKLNRSFVTPIDRSDIHALANGLDEMIDRMEHIAAKIRLYNITRIPESAQELIQLMLEASGEVVAATASLEKLDRLMSHCDKLHLYEDKADLICRKGIEDLFRQPPDPVELIKDKELLEDLEDTADEFENFAVIIEGVVVKNA
jgi:predicted phosphate transport protein (TIGR00153 family)